MVVAKKICERDLDVNKTEKVTMLEEIGRHQIWSQKERSVGDVVIGFERDVDISKDLSGK
jgi:hypothetical protein